MAKFIWSKISLKRKTVKPISKHNKLEDRVTVTLDLLGYGDTSQIKEKDIINKIHSLIGKEIIVDGLGEISKGPNYNKDKINKFSEKQSLIQFIENNLNELGKTKKAFSIIYKKSIDFSIINFVLNKYQENGWEVRISNSSCKDITVFIFNDGY